MVILSYFEPSGEWWWGWYCHFCCCVWVLVCVPPEAPTCLPEHISMSTPQGTENCNTAGNLNVHLGICFVKIQSFFTYNNIPQILFFNTLTGEIHLQSIIIKIKLLSWILLFKSFPSMCGSLYSTWIVCLKCCVYDNQYNKPVIPGNK